MGTPKHNSSHEYPLSEEHRMLLRMRDTLYEGSWEDFVRDLRTRANHEPHVFDTIPDTPGLEATIRRHLDLITHMKSWEQTNGRLLQAG
ncbi:MAG: hypothetical protein IH987_06140 [Planctomycetes bacterium]|nr:hypothetical protein [Planctomycetota bacterium]